MESSSNTHEVMQHDTIMPFSHVVEIKKETCDEDPIRIDKVDDFDFEPFHENIFRTLSTNFDNDKNIGEVNKAFANLETCFLENNILNKNGVSKFTLKSSNNSCIFFKYRDIDDAFIDLGITNDLNIRRTLPNQNQKKIDLKPFNETYFSLDDNETTFSDNDSYSKNGSDSDVNEECDSYFVVSHSDSEISDCEDSFDSELVDDSSTLFSNEVSAEPVTTDIRRYGLRNGKSFNKTVEQCESNDGLESLPENSIKDKVRDIRVVVEKLPSESPENSHSQKEDDSFSSLKSKSSVESRRQVARKKTGGVVLNPDINRDSSCNKEPKITNHLSNKDSDFVPNVFDKMTRAGKRDLERVLAESTANLVIKKTTQLISEKIKELQTQENESDGGSCSEDEAKESDIHKTAEIVTNTIIEFLTKSKSKKLDKLEKEINDEINNKINNLKTDTECHIQKRIPLDSSGEGSSISLSKPKLVEECTNMEVRETRGNTQRKKSVEPKKIPSSRKMSADSLEEIARIEKEIINYMEDASQFVKEQSVEEYDEPPRRPETRQSKLRQQQMLKNGSEKVNPTVEIRKRSQRTCVKKYLEKQNMIKAPSPDSLSVDSLINSSHLSDTHLKRTPTCDIKDIKCQSIDDIAETVSSNQNLENISSSPNSKTLKASADSTTSESALPILETGSFEKGNSNEQPQVDDNCKEKDPVDSVTSNYQENEISNNIINSIPRKEETTNLNEAQTNYTEESQSIQKSKVGQNVDESELTKSCKASISETSNKLEARPNRNLSCKGIEHKSTLPEKKRLDVDTVSEPQNNEAKLISIENLELDLKGKTDFNISNSDKEHSQLNKNDVTPKNISGIKEHINEKLTSAIDTFPESSNIDVFSEHATSFLNYTLDDSCRLTIDEDIPVSEKDAISDSKKVSLTYNTEDTEAVRPNTEKKNGSKKHLDECVEKDQNGDSKSKLTLDKGTVEKKSSNSNKDGGEEINVPSDQKNVSNKRLTNEEKIAQLTKRDPRLVPHDKKVVNVMIRDPRIRNKLPKKEEIPDKSHNVVLPKKEEIPDKSHNVVLPKKEEIPDKSHNAVLPKKEEIPDKSHGVVLESPLSPDSTPDSGKPSGQQDQKDENHDEKIDSNSTDLPHSSKSELNESVDPRKKKFKKAVDEELLYKTPLSDLHDSIGDRQSYERNGKKKKPSSRTMKRERELNNEKSSSFNRNRKDISEEREVLPPEDNLSERYYHRDTFSERNSLLPTPEEIPFRSDLRNSRLRGTDERPHTNDMMQEYQSGSRENFDQETYARRSRLEGNYSHEREFSDEQCYSRREFYRRNKFAHDHDHFSSSRFMERRQESQFYRQDNFSADSVSAYPPVSLLPDPMYNQDGEFDQTYGNMDTDSFSPPSSDLCPPPPPLIRSPPLDRERRDEYCPSPPRIGRCSVEDRDFDEYRSFNRNYEREQRNLRGRGQFSQESTNYGHRNITHGRRGNGRDRWNDESPPRKRFVPDYVRGREDERPRWRRSPSWSPDRDRLRRWSRERSLSPPIAPEAQPWDSPPPPNHSPPRWHDNYRDRNYRNDNYQRYY